MANLRISLLHEIFSNDGIVVNKYSRAYNNLLGVIELERMESKNKLPTQLFKEFETITQNSHQLSPLTSGVPFLILEQYYFRNYRDLSRELYIEYEEKNFSLKVKELYLLLEEFHLKIYLLSIKIADYYNLEFKLKEVEEQDSSFL